MQSRTRLYIPENELAQISAKTVAVAGLGGVGGTVVELLARLGVKRFRLCDKDKYELSNLNRQIYATLDTIGRYKADVCAERVTEINPYAEVERVLNERLDNDNAQSFIKGADVVFNETDMTSASLLLHRVAREHEVPLIDGHGYKKYSVMVHIYDYRNSHQRGLDEPFRLQFLNRLAKRLVTRTSDVAELSREELERLDGVPETQGSLDFVVCVAACLVVAETVKLFTGRGRTFCHPKEVCLDLFALKLRVRHKYSALNLVKAIWRRHAEIRRNAASLLGRP